LTANLFKNIIKLGKETKNLLKKIFFKNHNRWKGQKEIVRLIRQNGFSQSQEIFFIKII
jgi:hypothetical protein